MGKLNCFFASQFQASNDIELCQDGAIRNHLLNRSTHATHPGDEAAVLVKFGTLVNRSAEGVKEAWRIKNLVAELKQITSDYKSLQIKYKQLAEELASTQKDVVNAVERADRLEEIVTINARKRTKEITSDNPLRLEKLKILVLGDLRINQNTVLDLAADFGFSKENVSFLVDYEKLTCTPKKIYSYDGVIVGPCPHSTTENDEFGSIVEKLEKEDELPFAIARTESMHLKMTKNSVKVAFNQLVDKLNVLDRINLN